MYHSPFRIYYNFRFSKEQAHFNKDFTVSTSLCYDKPDFNTKE